MPEIKIESDEEAEEFIQQQLTDLERDVENCNVSMVKRADINRSTMTYYLNEGIIDQPTYFEYNNQTNSIIRNALKKCNCLKK